MLAEWLRNTCFTLTLVGCDMFILTFHGYYCSVSTGIYIRVLCVTQEGWSIIIKTLCISLPCPEIGRAHV